MSGLWSSGWATGDVTLASEYRKGIGCISDTTLGASAASIDITGIVGTYAHLMAVVYGRGDAAGTVITLGVPFNNDTIGDYDFQKLEGQGTGVVAQETFGATSAFAGSIPAASAGANLFNAQLIFIPHYSGAVNNKAFVSLSSVKYGTATTNMMVNLTGGFWRQTAVAINRITLLPISGNFVAGTRVSLYGMGA